MSEKTCSCGLYIHIDDGQDRLYVWYNGSDEHGFTCNEDGFCYKCGDKLCHTGEIERRGEITGGMMNCKRCNKEINEPSVSYHGDAGEWQYCKACAIELFTTVNAEGHLVGDSRQQAHITIGHHYEKMNEICRKLLQHLNGQYSIVSFELFDKQIVIRLKNEDGETAEINIPVRRE